MGILDLLKKSASELTANETMKKIIQSAYVVLPLMFSHDTRIPVRGILNLVTNKSDKSDLQSDELEEIKEKCECLVEEVQGLLCQNKVLAERIEGLESQSNGVTTFDGEHETLSVTCDGKNYSLRFLLQCYAIGKGLWGHIDGTIKCPDESNAAEYKKWSIDDTKIISLILNSMEPSLTLPLTQFTLAKDMWEYLERVYQHDVFNFQQDDRSVQEYHEQFVVLWGDYEKIVMNNVTKSDCVEGLRSLLSINQVIYFLMKLRPEFEPFRANVINKETLPSLDSLLGDLLLVEIRMAAQATFDAIYGDEQGFTGHQGRRTHSSSQRQCNNCKEYGHIFAHCEKIICAYCKEQVHHISKYSTRPKKPHSRFHHASLTYSSSQRQCFNCKEYGHTSIHCEKIICAHCKGHGHDISKCRAGDKVPFDVFGKGSQPKRW